MEGISVLPKLNAQDLAIWDVKRALCGGYLFKKASEASKFSKGKWQKRWFALKTDISAHENYTLQYYYSPDETTPRQVYSLDGSRVAIGTDDRNSDSSFDIFCLDGTKISMSAESEEILQAWMASLEDVVEIATSRGKVQRQRRGAKPAAVETVNMIPASASQRSNNIGEYDGDEDADNANVFSGNNNSTGNYFKQSSSDAYGGGMSSNQPYASNVFQLRSRRSPTVRLDIDTHSMPPGSTERHQFEEMLINDIQRILKIDQVKLIVTRSTYKKDVC